MDVIDQAGQLARFSSILADRTRSAFCLALLDGRAWTAGELAVLAGVAPPTATGHLDRLIAEGLVTQRKQGRHRYVELAGPDIARLLENLLGHLDPPAAPSGLRRATASAVLARGRTCYDHLAGRLGVAITDAMAGGGFLDRSAGLRLTDAGFAWYTTELRVDATRLRGSRRPLVRSCLDWTERRPHLAGLAGAVLCSRAREEGWIVAAGSGRGVRLTPSGERTLTRRLELDVDALRHGTAAPAR